TNPAVWLSSAAAVTEASSARYDPAGAHDSTASSRAQERSNASEDTSSAKSGLPKDAAWKIVLEDTGSPFREATPNPDDHWTCGPCVSAMATPGTAWRARRSGIAATSESIRDSLQPFSASTP